MSEPSSRREDSRSAAAALAAEICDELRWLRGQWDEPSAVLALEQAIAIVRELADQHADG